MVATLSAVILAGRGRGLPCSGLSGVHVHTTGGYKYLEDLEPDCSGRFEPWAGCSSRG